MIAEIFTITQDGEFKPTANALGVPEFHNLWFKVENPEIYFLYIHYMLFPKSAYSEYPENEKEAAIHHDFPVDKTNMYFILAFDKAEKMFNTSLQRGFKATKIAYDTYSFTMSNVQSITFGVDGNAKDVKAYLMDADELMKRFNSVESQYKESISMYGSRELAFDEKIDYENEDGEELDFNDEE